MPPPTGAKVKFCLGQGQVQGHDLIGRGYVAYQSIRIVVRNTSKLTICIAFACLLKVIAEKLSVNFHALK